MRQTLHIMTHSPYTIRYISFVNKYFCQNDHKFIVYCEKEEGNNNKDYPYKNVIFTKNKMLFRQFRGIINASKMLIIHQLNHPVFMLELLFFAPKILKKTAWVLWGGDVYYAQYNKTIKSKIIEFLREKVIKRIPLIISYVKGDFDVIQKQYNSGAKYLKADYPSPIDISAIEKTCIKDVDDLKKTKIIVLGNSADPSNEHFESIDILSKYKNESILIKCILSYGGNDEYKNQVIKYGKEKFEEKFLPILEYQSFDEYLEMINASDICVLNHKRQQGLGNQKVFLMLMKKLYISNVTTPFDYFKSIDINIDATEKIVDMSYEEFIRTDNKYLLNNRVNILNDISNVTIQKAWEVVFNNEWTNSFNTEVRK
ncbi:hypothetical protein GCM10007916_06880 [Psychromonas marina]|uniref:4-alpha-L-fucosyltransferase n=1 Tax=Psychromonas marina TaxID=88364 RepID=A0ABQ6DWU4_9GAMM|nr:TDP-N-acetylfucosamine:lipid II N-acetylfucosaminyltransferase [Psychromonas marina]GLS89621.1 hypothetical protein GCM10007916_06880 [Psychromonas marina]